MQLYNCNTWISEEETERQAKSDNIRNDPVRKIQCDNLHGSVTKGHVTADTECYVQDH